MYVQQKATELLSYSAILRTTAQVQRQLSSEPYSRRAHQYDQDKSNKSQSRR